MALAEINFHRIRCAECRNREAVKELGALLLATQGGRRCHCRIVTDFYIGEAGCVFAEMEVARQLLGLPAPDPFDGY